MALLEARGITVRFGGNLAVNDVDLDVEVGQVTGLIGPNGAGKTTTFNALTGLQPTVRGTVKLGLDDLTGLPTYKRARKGIARTFQRLELFSLLSVRENVEVAIDIRKRWARGSAAANVDEVLEQVGIAHLADERSDTLPTGTARLVELARALASKPRVLLLDEPSSGLNERETEGLGRVLLDLAGEGLAVLLVEHDMGLVMSTCKHIQVLDFGQVIATGTPAQIQSNEEVKAAYLGAETADRTAAPPRAKAPDADGRAPVLELRDVRAAYGEIEVLDGVSFEVEQGGVFALLGPNGAGKSTTLKTISGHVPPVSGQVLLCGRPVQGADPDAIARAGVCTIPEGRGIFANLSVVENLRMVTYTGASFSDVKEKAFARFPRLAERRNQLAGTLSGGEQQMLAMARALSTDPELLLLDELSMGLAPIIVQELYDQVRQIAEGGTTILIVEQFAHEVMGVADTAAIMLYGRVQRVGPPAEIADELADAYLAGASG
jgi:ABC-type branched-subunit amino acid transport system ATPase component